jgi:hypothetical protein
MNVAWVGRVGILGALVLAAIAGVGPAHADKRVALIVGNAAYRHVPPLDNPANDARLVAGTLHDLGFELVGGAAQINLDKARFERAVQDFGNAAQGADVALFYYAGHGVQMRGQNYLVPIGANPAKEADFDFQALDSNAVLRQMQNAGARLNIILLDACRNNPFKGRGLRGLGGGLAQMQAPEGTLISFATQPGDVALDGDTGHSPYTLALTSTLRKPGLDIFRTFNEVGLSVADTTKGAQMPWVSSSPIKGDFYFGGRGKNGGSAEAQIAAMAARLKELEKTLKEKEIAPAKKYGSSSPEREASLAKPNAPKTSDIAFQNAVLFEEDPKNPQGRRYVGRVIWRTDNDLSENRNSREISVRADVVIPERSMKVSWEMRRNTDRSLPASHTIAIKFTLPQSFVHGGVTNVPGLMMKQSEQARGAPLVGLSVKVTNGYFLIGLSAIDTDRRRNTELLKERGWLDIPIVYDDGKRAILALEKGGPGKTAFETAFRAWLVNR